MSVNWWMTWRLQSPHYYLVSKWRDSFNFRLWSFFLFQFVAVPRLLTRIYCKIHDSVKSNVVKNFLLNTAYYFKQKQIEKTGIVKHNTIWDKIVFNKVRENLGGKVRLIMSGSAPLNPNVLEFLRCSLGCLVSGHGSSLPHSNQSL